MDTRKWFITLLLITIVCVVVDVFAVGAAKVPPKPEFLKNLLEGPKINPGIDIAGGAEITYQILYDKDKAKGEEERRTKGKQPQEVIKILKDRIDQRKLKEPRLTTLGDDRIVIQIAVQDEESLKDYKKLLERVGKLDLRKVAPAEIHRQWTDTPGWQENPEATAPGGWMAIKNDSKMSGDYQHLDKDYILVSKDAVVTGGDIKNAFADQSMEEGWTVRFELHDEGGKKFDTAAKELYHQNPRGLIAIIMDGEITSKPRINSEKFGGGGTITGGEGGFPKKEAETLAIVLKSGQLPVQIGSIDEQGNHRVGVPESENFIGPTLAQDSLTRGVTAAVVSVVFVALFMLLYYRIGGLVAVFTLFCNLVYLIAIMAFFGATMTLPGLAGLALTVAMAVDANILILERVREEMAKGKTALQAFESGHQRAFSAILDGNVTTLIAGIVLYVFGTDAVKGFATVLCIGIATTMFSVLVMGKNVLNLLVQNGTIREFRMMKWWTTTNVNFTRLFTPCVLLSALVFTGSIGIFVKRAKDSLGMDFKGGTRLIFKLNEEKPIQYVRERVDGIKGPDGKPLYPDAEVTAMSREAGTQATKIQIFARTASSIFQIRSSTQDLATLQGRVQDAFLDDMSHEPFDPYFAQEIPGKFKIATEEGPQQVAAGGGFHFYVKAEGTTEAEVRAKVREIALGLEGISKDPERKGADDKAEPNVDLERVEPAPKGLMKFRILFAQPDLKVVKEGDPPTIVPSFVAKIREAGVPLSQSPFTAPGRIGPTAASDLRDSTIWALVISWVLMIVYVAIRFTSWKFGVGAVIALIHNSVIAVGFVVFCGWVVPKSWGLSFEMNVTTLAAILTVIGYSINDTVVVFDRIRENLVLMKKDTFAQVVNTSVNQTMSRTILTGTSVLATLIILYVFTMTSAGGVAEFALPMFVGVLAGTYASVYVATSCVLWLFRGQRPVVAR